jgi:predicted alpha-1,2-mannosidase
MVLFFNHSGAQTVDSLHSVDPMIGTNPGAIGYGGTMPFVTPPFGMTDWTPQSRQNKVGGVSYRYDDTSISGFMGTHQPAIWMGDYGYITIMPELDRLKTTPDNRKLTFRHEDEIARPDYYAVTLDAGDSRKIRTEMTATARCAYMRFTFPANASSIVMVEASRPGTHGSAIVSTSKGEIVGYNADRMDSQLGPLKLPNFKGYFVIQFKQHFSASGSYGPTTQDQNQAMGAYASFKTSKGQIVDVRVGTSFISIEQARKNLELEIPQWNFEVVRHSLASAWSEKLDKVSLDGGSAEQRKTIYTALYHALLYPRIFSEHGRYYSAFDDTIHRGVSYTAYSIWDTFRAEFSLLTLLVPERIDGMIGALLQDYTEGGWMPKWPNPSYTNIMIGTHADSIVAEAMNKGFHGFDYGVAWDAVYKDAMTPPDGDTTRRWYDREPNTPYEGRAGLTYLKQLGYIPADKTAESASSTLEDSYDDWCVAQVARLLGKTKEFSFFLDRSLDYKNLFNRSTGFMQARNFDGTWADPKTGWTEGDHWVYTWAVLHDIPGLMDLMGGRENYNKLLDEHFNGNHNVHKNEPSHHYAYLYDFSGEPWKTQTKVREIAAAEYSSLPSGLDGDDDCGQMSAWYLFAALGFYPVNPASGNFMIGSPIFTRMSIELAHGRRLTVVARNNSSSNVYIQSATLNGKPLTVPVITYRELVAGATLTFVMGPKPSNWGTDWITIPLAASATPKTQ